MPWKHLHLKNEKHNIDHWVELQGSMDLLGNWYILIQWLDLCKTNTSRCNLTMEFQNCCHNIDFVIIVNGLQNSMIITYFQQGWLEYAHHVAYQTSQQDTILWTIMLMKYAHNCSMDKSQQCLITFLSIMLSHRMLWFGKIKDGQKLFKRMT